MTGSAVPDGGAERPLALTMGEPAGVGGEITLMAWLERGEGSPPFLAVDDPARLERLARRLDLAVPVSAVETPAEAIAVFANALPVMARPLAAEPVPGRPDPANAPAVRASIEDAVTLVRSGGAAAVVTNPVHKRCLIEGGFPYPGHTEFLAALAGTAQRPVMMLVSDRLRVVPVTIHMALAEALAALSEEAVVETAIIAEAGLRLDFAVPRPRLAVAGLNPHAGEGGEMGSEEAAFIAPAVEALRRQGIDAFGPAAADSLFHAEARKGYDAAICMYHDQALIPIKSIAFESTVNVTLGLPFVRTSPGHGTALDIAGTGKANPASLIAAMRTAAAMARRRDVGNR